MNIPRSRSLIEQPLNRILAIRQRWRELAPSNRLYPVVFCCSFSQPVVWAISRRQNSVLVGFGKSVATSPLQTVCGNPWSLSGLRTCLPRPAAFRLLGTCVLCRELSAVCSACLSNR
jgi:hypothetical protein